jgi:hypothetical protein
MKYDDLTINKLRELSILDVADKLGFKLKGLGDEGRRALCPYHDDKHPSLHFSKKKGIFKCFVCGAKGDLFKLVMDARNCTFVEACEWLINEFHVVIAPNTNLTNPTNKKISEISAIRVQKENYNSCSEINNSSDSSNSLTKVQSVALQSCSGKTSVSSVKSVVPKITSALCPLPSDIVTKCLSLNSEFCKSVVSSGYLSKGQLHRSAARYRLGATKDGGVIFWQIDDHQQVHTGKIMYYQSDCHRDKQHHPTWVHCLMKDQLPPNYEFHPCLFGLHLLSNTDLSDNTDNSRTNTDSLRSRVWRCESSDLPDNKFSNSLILENNKSVQSVKSVVPKIAIVESEKSAVILSEKFPDFVWLSCGGLQAFKAELLAPLVDYKVVIFPDTDPTGDAFRQWSQVATEAQRLYKFRYPLRVSPLLESHASPEQKQRKIDLVDYLYEACDSARTVSCSHEHCRAQADSTEGQHESH